MDIDMEHLRARTLDFVARCRTSAGCPQYRYSSAVARPTLYSSAYAAMTRSLYNDLDALTNDERQAWINYLNFHQDDDGLFRDPVIFGQGWYRGDPFWCGRTHLTCHVIIALACLGGAAARPFAIVDEFCRPGRIASWLDERDWGARVSTTGNEIMNLGTLLQYARDFHNDRRAGRAVEQLLDWLDAHHVSAETGLWGTLDVSDPIMRSHAVQAAYHWWTLYFYDGRRPPHMERAIDAALATQNPQGGFGWGVHNPTEPFKSSACEDIDSIDPLARMSLLTDYRRDDIRAALERAAPCVLRNQTPDGGFVFILDRAFEYGHPDLRGPAGAGAMFPTWFRTLSLAMLGKGLPDHSAGRYPWHFCRCPGYQFAT